jgi:hypothetical protein
LQIGRGGADFVPVFVPIAKVRCRETFRFRTSPLPLQASQGRLFAGFGVVAANAVVSAALSGGSRRIAA